ncbi:MAG: DUF402 domain-containing protein [Erysipelotrichaceae bacterium]|nr:DUF402 domain-containing protein [Erysipelotrichaceae bacterium]MBR5754506.1 DUF402 domain-containing protein [Erysipelotrichaceae bacterium]
MERLKIGDRVFVESYKHDGSVHRTWSKAMVIDVLQNCYVVVTDYTWVVESDHRRWLTKEPAICFYYTDKWFNIISMIRRSGIYYYCNIASPSVYDGEAIKNIDYDLDVKVFPDGTRILLDENEFEYHTQKMNYPKETVDMCFRARDELLQMIDSKQDPFNFTYTNDYVMKYFELNYTENSL